jgi:transposase
MTAKVHSTSAKTKRDRRLWDKPVYLILRKRRFRCLGCGKVFTEPDAVCEARRRISKRFRHQLGQEAIDQPVRHVARREGVGEALVRRCFTEEAGRMAGVPFKPIAARILGLDEFSVKKGRVYDTAIVNLEGKQIIGVVSGHRQKEVEDFFDSLPQPEKVQVVLPKGKDGHA